MTNLSTENERELSVIHTLLDEAERKLLNLKETATNSDKTIQPVKRLAFDSFFQYSVILPSIDEGMHNTFILGNFQITNIGTETIHNPLICLKLSPSTSGNISGKISYGKGTADSDTLFTTTEEWTYLEYDWRKKVRNNGEHWLKPLHADAIAPGETLTFSNFQLKFSEKVNGECTLEGFVYCKEDSKGKAAKNRITLHLPSDK